MNFSSLFKVLIILNIFQSMKLGISADFTSVELQDFNNSTYSPTSSPTSHSHDSALVLIEEMNGREDFVSLQRSPSHAKHELVFAIKQLGLDQLDQILLNISTPGNPMYQQWLSFDQVGDLIANSNGTSAVVSWLESEGVSVSWTSHHSEYLKATANISTWERILNTQFFLYQDVQLDESDDDSNSSNDDDLTRISKNRRKKKTADGSTETPPIVYHRAQKYYLPTEITNHLTAIFNTVQVPPKMQDKYQQLDDESEESISFRLRGAKKRHVRSTIPGPNSVTVPFLNSLYKIPSNIGSPQISQAVIETEDEYFSQQDLALFQKTFNLTIQKAQDHMGYNTSDCGAVAGHCFEGNLDIQYMMGIAQKTTSVYWYSSYHTSDPFLAWITEVSNMPNPPMTNSISWSINEQYVSPSTMNNFNIEAMKLTIRGVTILVAAGDNGVAGIDCSCDGYYPSFPATSPYVTAVGATMGPDLNKTEVTCQSDKGGLITSGGGFSLTYPAPAWQQPYLSKYLGSQSPPPVQGYNPSGRGYPDVSLIGVKYNVMVKGNLYQRYGTSASTPALAAMISLVNAKRLGLGLGPVGFINPTLYSVGAQALFNDIVVGTNNCCVGSRNPKCCQQGFDAAPGIKYYDEIIFFSLKNLSNVGWDPLTGLGSIYFPNLLQLLNPPVSAISRKIYPPTTKPSNFPSTRKPSSSPTTITPSGRPSLTPSSPSMNPSGLPSLKPTSIVPSDLPSLSPSISPPITPTKSTSISPSSTAPSLVSTLTPSVSTVPPTSSFVPAPTSQKPSTSLVSSSSSTNPTKCAH